MGCGDAVLRGLGKVERTVGKVEQGVGDWGAHSGGMGCARWGKVERTVAKTQAAGCGVGAGLSVDGEGRGAE